MEESSDNTSSGRCNARQGSKNRKVTLGKKFRNELTALVDLLSSTSPRFVRCMKSNMQKVGDYYESEVMLKQLRYSGLLEVCRIRQSGYPSRITYEQFYHEFWTLDSSVTNGKELVHRLRNQGLFDTTQFQCGNSKVFFKKEAFDSLTAARYSKLYVHVTRIQAFYKGYLMRCKWKQVSDTGC